MSDKPQRGRPPKVIPPIPAKFKDVLRAVAKPVKKQ